MAFFASFFGKKEKKNKQKHTTDDWKYFLHALKTEVREEMKPDDNEVQQWHAEKELEYAIATNPALAHQLIEEQQLKGDQAEQQSLGSGGDHRHLGYQEQAAAVTSVAEGGGQQSPRIHVGSPRIQQGGSSSSDDDEDDDDEDEEFQRFNGSGASITRRRHGYGTCNSPPTMRSGGANGVDFGASTSSLKRGGEGGSVPRADSRLSSNTGLSSLRSNDAESSSSLCGIPLGPSGTNVQSVRREGSVRSAGAGSRDGGGPCSPGSFASPVWPHSPHINSFSTTPKTTTVLTTSGLHHRKEVAVAYEGGAPQVAGGSRRRTSGSRAHSPVENTLSMMHNTAINSDSCFSPPEEAEELMPVVSLDVVMNHRR